jgi:hypothetical protein
MVDTMHEVQNSQVTKTLDMEITLPLRRRRSCGARRHAGEHAAAVGRTRAGVSGAPTAHAGEAELRSAAACR